MDARWRMPLLVVALSVGSLAAATAQLSAPIPTAIATPSLALAVVLHAEGAQIYECRAASDGNLAWRAREPIATLVFDGSTGRAPLRGSTLGVRRWEHGARQVGRQHAWRVRGRYPVAPARCRGPARQRQIVRRDPSRACQHPGWRSARTLRRSRRFPQRALLGGLRLFAKGLTPCDQAGAQDCGDRRRVSPHAVRASLRNVAAKRPSRQRVPMRSES
ncbi:hypothetical protein ACVWYH_004260 [Bradyrhizobium sp. GM24.11]